MGKIWIQDPQVKRAQGALTDWATRLDTNFDMYMYMYHRQKIYIDFEVIVIAYLERKCVI